MAPLHPQTYSEVWTKATTEVDKLFIVDDIESKFMDFYHKNNQ